MNLKQEFLYLFAGKSLEQRKNRKQRSLNGAPLLFILLLSWSLGEWVVSAKFYCNSIFALFHVSKEICSGCFVLRLCLFIAAFKKQ